MLLNSRSSEDPDSSTRRTQRPSRPSIQPDTTDEDWRLFLFQWERYKNQCKLTSVSAIRDELLSTCSQDLEKQLFNLAGTSLNGLTEEKLLAQIKEVAVRGLNVEVHRHQFHAMRQSQGEDITQYVSRLRSKASLCSFSVTAFRPTKEAKDPGPVSYEEDALRTQMVVGLYDKEHQNRILNDTAKHPSFKELYQALLTMEAADTSRLKLSDSKQQTTDTDLSAAQRSQYQRDRRNRNHPPETSKKETVTPCRWCNGTTHDTTQRWQHDDCPARGKLCKKCGKLNHVTSACRSTSSQRRQRPQWRSQDETSAQQDVSDSDDISFCFSQDEVKIESEHDQPAKGGNPHQEWKHGEFVDSRPKRHPEVNVKLTILHDSHEKMGKFTSLSTRAKMVSGVTRQACADTGAMTCTSGPELLQALNCPRQYLVRTRHRIQGVTGDGLQIMGTLLLQIELGERSTRQVVYITKNTSGLYLSETALRDLGLIHPEFPNVQQDLPPTSAEAAACSSTEPKTAACGCPLRTPVPDNPSNLPYPPTEENRHKLEEWIRLHFASSAFNVCEHQALPPLSGKPMDIKFKSDATPHAVHVPIPIPYHWKLATKKGLDRDVQLGVIEPVPQGTPTVWCSRMVVTGKNDGSPRRTVDLQKVNEATMRETHHTPTPYNLVADVPPNTVKTVLDAWNGYHSLPLSESARDATTFITEFGRYRYLRAPQGFHASGDAYTRRISDITEGIPRVKQCIDDALLWDTDIESSFWHTLEYISRCAGSGVVFNPSKFVFGSTKVDFAGFTIDRDGYKPTAKMLSAIKDFPTPTNVTGIRSWFGLVNQVAYAFAQSAAMAPFRELLKEKGTRFFWDDNLDSLFKKSKEIIVEQVREGVKSFELHRATCLSTDWSKNGVGFLLQQKHCSCPLEKAPHCGPGHWRLIFAGSRFTTEAESRYAPVEGEALALVYALEQCRMFVMGCKSLIVAVDHKPLVKIFSDQSLDNIKNPRILRLKEKSLRYKFAIKHTPGRGHAGPDAASRYPTEPCSAVACSRTPDVSKAFLDVLRHQPTSDDAGTSQTIHAAMLKDIAAAQTTSSDSLRAITWELVKKEALVDRTCVELVRLIESGFTATRTELPDHLKPFWQMRHELYHIEGVPFLEHKMLIPSALRTEVLDSLHSAHQGEVGMKNSARRRLFWPGMDAQIAQRRAQCRTCAGMSPSQAKEPILDSPSSEFPFEVTCCDFFELAGHHYLVYVDRYSGWSEIAKVPSTAFQTLVANLRRWFTQWGVPKTLETDGGPPFSGRQFGAFMEQWGVQHRQSSAYYAQSNGRAELAVKAAKRLLRDNTSSSGELNTDGVTRALLQYRNTPLRGIEDSPAEIIFGRRLRDGLPTPTSSRPEWKRLRILREMSAARLHARVVDRYNQHTKELRPLNVGDVVLIQNQAGACPRRWDLTGVVVEKLDNRQYRIKVHGSGRITLRNRRFIRLLHPFVDTERKATVTVRPPSVPLSPSLLTQPMTTPMRDHQPGDPPAIQHHQPATPPSATRRPSHVSGDDTHVPGHNTYQTHQGSAVTPPHRNQRWATPSAEPGEALCPVSPTSAAGPVHQTGEPRETTVSPGRTPAADVGRRHPPPSPPPASSKPVPVEPPQCEETRPESRRSTRRAIPRRRFSPQMRGKFHRVSSDV